VQLDEALPEAGPNDGATRIAERRPLLLVPVPGESSWVAAPRAAAARASLAAVVAAAGGASGGGAAAAKRPRDGGEGGEGGEGAMSVSMMASDVTGQTTADDGDSAGSRARLAAGGAAPASGQPGEGGGSSSASGAGADLPPGCCMAYVSAAEWIAATATYRSALLPQPSLPAAALLVQLLLLGVPFPP
jgi:hypothetical protein